MPSTYSLPQSHSYYIHRQATKQEHNKIYVTHVSKALIYTFTSLHKNECIIAFTTQ